jgi:transposase-like protein
MSTVPTPIAADHEFSPDSTLTPEQHRIVTLLAAGYSITEAAAAENIHRNTVGYWRRTQPNFARELEFAIREQRLYWHEQANRLAPQAIATLEELLTNPGTSPSLRFRAATLILKMATDPQTKPIHPTATAVPELEAISGQVHALRKDLLFRAPAAETLAETIAGPEPASDNSNIVQAANIAVAAQICTKPQPIRVPARPGRNTACPCGSGLKFKRCCITKAA